MPRIATNDSYILDKGSVLLALKGKGVSSLRELAKVAGVHRNTLNNYLKGTPVLPDALNRILLTLDLSLNQASKRTMPTRNVKGMRIAALIDSLCSKASDCVFVLFGSRAREHFKEFSDYDIGVFRERGIPFPLFSSMLDQVAEWNDDQSPTVQLTNLSGMDAAFADAIKEDLCILSGSMVEWLNLLKRVGVSAYEGRKTA